MNERGCWTLKEETDTHVFDQYLSDAILDLFSVSEIIDMGCGDGSYTRYFCEKGYNCSGYDGSPLTPELSNGLCKIMDFSIPQYIDVYELVVCLEVGEHVPQEYEEIFIENICSASGKWICLSWAIEGQDGIGHVNCHNNDYIIEKLEQKGFRFDIIRTQYLREASRASWCKNTLMVFEKWII